MESGVKMIVRQLTLDILALEEHRQHLMSAHLFLLEFVAMGLKVKKGVMTGIRKVETGVQICAKLNLDMLVLVTHPLFAHLIVETDT